MAMKFYWYSLAQCLLFHDVLFQKPIFICLCWLSNLQRGFCFNWVYFKVIWTKSFTVMEILYYNLVSLAYIIYSRYLKSRRVSPLMFSTFLFCCGANFLLEAICLFHFLCFYCKKVFVISFDYLFRLGIQF